MLKEVLRVELEGVDLSMFDDIELEEEFAGCGVGSNKDTGKCSGSCGTLAIELS